MIWTPYDWLHKGYSFYIAAVSLSLVGVALELKLVIVTNLVKSKLSLFSHYFHLNIPFKQLHASCKTEHFSYKGGYDVHG